MLTVGRVGAGSGCRYLTEQVAPGKDDFAALSPTEALSYYSDSHAHGESPGRWLGRGLGTLGLEGAVAAKELENLVGHARHPHYDEILQKEALRLLSEKLTPRQRQAALVKAEKSLYLGRAFAIYESAGERAERAVAELGEDADEASRDAIRAQVLAEGDRQAVAGYELTFTPVKSVSILGALGGEATWALVMEAHRAAVDTALGYIQEHAAYSRSSTNGIRQVDTQGLIISAFEHRMSREGDPNIHTHAIVANRVLCEDGEWRTVDGRAIYSASVGARAVYEQALETFLGERLGVAFNVDERKTIREVAGVPLALIEQFSKRRAAIEKAIGDDDGETVNSSWWRQRARRITLATRPKKDGTESTTEAVHRWLKEMRRAGIDPEQILVTARRPAQIGESKRTDGDLLAEALEVLTQTRGVWSRHHAVLALCRVLPPPPGGKFEAHQARIEALADRLLAGGRVQQVTPPELMTTGPTLRRDSDGQSVFTAHLDVLYAASSTVEQEQRILAAATDRTAARLQAQRLDQLPAVGGLAEDQLEAVRQVLGDGGRVSAIVGPAGTGKTYVQRAVAAAWAAEGRNVLALAPSQIAASVLGETIGCRAENVIKWLYENNKVNKRGTGDEEWTLRKDQLVILDEAGMASTRDLSAIITAVRRAGAKLLLVGDDKQLGAVGAGGMFATVVQRTDAPVLATVRRFREADGTVRTWESQASLGLRDRDIDAVAEYERRGRLHAGPVQRMEETSYRAWLTDHLAFAEAGTGDVALLMADTEAGAAALSRRARTDLVRRGIVRPDGTLLADGCVAGVGDLIVTRLNERRIRGADGEGFVANRDTWRVVERHDDGALTVASLRGEAHQITLPAAYVTANVQLAYAGTVHSAQGRTVTTARGLVTESTTAESLYVMLTRGWLSNDAYVVTEDPDRELHQLQPEQHALSVLARILGRDDRPTLSVTDTERALYDEATSIRRLRIIFGDLAAVIQGESYAQVIADHAGAAAARHAVADPAWSTLVRALSNAQTAGWDSHRLLADAVGQRELGSAQDAAAVLHWRCEGITSGWRAPAGGTTAAASTWTERANLLAEGHPDSPVVNEAAETLLQVAALIDGRADSLAAGLATQAAEPSTPEWIAALGSLPEAGARRVEWIARARAVAIYHDATGYQPTLLDPIGARPPGGDVEARELWSAAREALADAPAAATMRAMLPERLRAYRAAGEEAELVTQPPYVGHDLRRLSLRARAQRTRVNRLRREVAAAVGKLAIEDRRKFRRNEPAVASLRRTHDELAARLTQGERTLGGIEPELAKTASLHEEWQRWEEETRDVRFAARLAAQELAIRGIADEAPEVVEAEVDDADPAAVEQQRSILAEAARWFGGRLEAAWAAEYLRERGLGGDAVLAAAGYSGGEGQWTELVDHLRGLGFGDDALVAAGIAVRSRRGSLIDRFRNRLVLPVLNPDDQVIGFLGRKAPADRDPNNPKYLNPTKTLLYSKAHVLFGLDSAAIDQLRAGAPAVIVEGPTDQLAIWAAQAGIVPVATCGTALTEGHLDLLSRYTDLGTVMLGYDGDAAGRAAAVKAGALLAERGVAAGSTRVLALGEGQDPASVLASTGVAGLASWLGDPESFRPLLDVMVDQRLDWWGEGDFTSAVNHVRLRAARDAIELLAKHLDAEVPRQLARIADRTRVEPSTLNAFLLERAFPAAVDDETRERNDLLAVGSETWPELWVQTEGGGACPLS